MRLSTLSLEQFRSYTKLTLVLDSTRDVHVLLGPNASGKTNILEAISVLALTKSCQGIEEADLMQWGTEYYRICADIVYDAGDTGTLEVVSQIAPRKQKACFRNDVKSSIGDMIGCLLTVLFLPQDLDLFTGSPQRRRRFLDQLLCQVSPEYLIAFSQYQKVLKQRNKLLRSIADGSAKRTELAIWDQALAEQGAIVTTNRLELIEVMQCTIEGELNALGEKWSNVQLVYERKGKKQGLQETEHELVTLLEHYLERDVLLQSTTVGPHREDWHMDIDGRSLPTFASRGQQRTAVLALLFLEVSYLELRRGEKPLILLDDVFSELDDAHQSALLRCFAEHQVIITTTHIPSNLYGAQVWEVGDGEITCVPCSAPYTASPSASAASSGVGVSRK